MKNKKIVVGISVLLGIGLVSQIVEQTIDKPAIQSYVEKNFNDSPDQNSEFDFKDDEEIDLLN